MSELPDNLTPVREVHVFDEARLADCMKANVEGYRAPMRILQFEGGQSNPTFHLTDAGGRMYVLRKKPPGKLLPSAHQVDREYRVIKALTDHSDVPVPKPYALCQDDAVIGTAFYIMEFLPGRILVDPKLPGVSPADRAKLFDSMNDVLARIHNVDYRAAGLGDFGREGQYIQRQIGRWSSQYDLSRTANIEAMELLGLEGGAVAARRQKPDPDVAAAVGRHHWSADRQPAVQRDTIRLHPRRLGRLDNRAGKSAARKPGDRGGRIRPVLPGTGVDETALVVRLRIWRSGLAHDEDREPAARGVDRLRLGRRRNRWRRSGFRRARARRRSAPATTR